MTYCPNLAVPWYERGDTFCHCDTPLPPPWPPVPFPTPPTSKETYEEEQRRLDEEFFAWHDRMARTPVIFPTPELHAPSQQVAETKFAQMWHRASTAPKSWMGTLKKTLKYEYARVAFACERVYWLKLTAYRQSKWPHLLRMLRYFVLMLLALALVAYTAKLKMAEWAEEAAQAREVTYVLVPRYSVRSVTKPRCEYNCPCDVSCPTTFG
ncbi:hypothetical protein F5Y13DRAFT_194641 [Hypoxylon sp. FL1857]|nr:hypothetical protein F5Y13DRAFT_194641 [Hypoxylon sp. FL1857]